MEELCRIDYSLFKMVNDDLIKIMSRLTLEQMQQVADKHSIPPQLVHYINYYVSIIHKYFMMKETIYGTGVPDDQVYEEGYPLEPYYPPALFVQRKDIERISLKYLPKHAPHW